jgi:hypothetical protein
MTIEHWTVGHEYDEALFERLKSVLRALGYHIDIEWSGVAGSQDISHWEISCPAGTLQIEAETYIGLSITGPVQLVAGIRERFLGTA